MIRAWEGLSGKRWHQLSPRSRVNANAQLEMMSKDVLNASVVSNGGGTSGGAANQSVIVVGKAAPKKGY